MSASDPCPGGPISRPHREGRVGLRSALRKVVDDRGRPTRPFNRADLARAARSENPGLAMLANRLRAAVRSEARRTTPDRLALTVALVFGVLVLNGVLVTTFAVSLGVGGAGMGLLSLGALTVLANRVYKRYVRRGAVASLARTAVAEGVCGACAFSLQGAPEAPDGMIVCPECGAAWRAERVVAPFWERPAFPVLRRRFLAAIAPGVRAPGVLFAPDDRGRYVQCPDSRLMRVRTDLLGQVPVAEQRALRRSMRRVGRWPRVALMLAFSWMPGFLLYGCWRLYEDGERSGLWVLLAITLPITLAVSAIPLGSAFGGPHRTSRAIVRHGRCGSCLKPLRSAPVDDEQRRICPRCGAAWLA